LYNGGQPEEEHPMSSTRLNALRNVAEAELDRRLGQLDPRLRQDLATSLVRQWLTGDGHAGLVTPAGHLWFRMVRTEAGGFEVGFDAQPPRFLDRLRDWQVADRDIPRLLHQLNLSQEVWCRSDEGRQLRLRMVARERTLLVEPVAQEEA
jgi:hypothetical protein